jgi:ABC-2 type transport system permease protein
MSGTSTVVPTGSMAKRPESVRDRPSPPIQPIPLGRLVSVEIRKMFDTRSGFWLMSSIGILSVIATVAVILFAADDEVTYMSFAAATGFPMSIILPMIAVLSVTSEWSQRSGLTTFTLIPHRGRVVLAKAIATVGVAVVSMLLALAIGVLGNLVGSALAGVPTTWDASVSDLLFIVLGNVLGLLMGFMLGVAIRNSAGAIVGYFVFSLVLPPLSELLDASASWFHSLRPWVDFRYNQSNVFDGHLTGEQWANLGVTSLVWLIIPLTLGVWMLLRSEVK